MRGKRPNILNKTAMFCSFVLKDSRKPQESEEIQACNEGNCLPHRYGTVFKSKIILNFVTLLVSFKVIFNIGKSMVFTMR